MKRLGAAAIGAFIIGAASMGQAATVDFSDFVEGDQLGANTDLGNGIFANVSSLGGVNQAVIFDTARGTTSTANDPDLTANFRNAEDASDVRDFGNVVIVQENLRGGPDDTGAGGTLTIDFNDDILLESLYLVDAKIGTTAELFLGGTVVQSFVLGATNESDTGNNPNNNLFTFLDFGNSLGDSLIVTLSASGGIGELELSVAPTPVPVPASLPLLAGGLGLMSLMRRRRKAA
ncbi:MAG: VPLPA-CTERM sorting domain-containing protein [Paracoccaceae bacterium]